MKSILLSIHPKWVELILSGKKTIEIRKSKPNLNPPFKCYIYSTQGAVKDLFAVEENTYKNRMHVVAEFICDEIIPIRVFENGAIQDYNCNSLEASCVPYAGIADYIGYGKLGYGWKISDLIIYDTPLSLDSFIRYGYLDAKYKLVWSPDLEAYKVTRPPQSYMYVEDLSEIAAELNYEKEVTSTSLIDEYLNIADPAERLNFYRNLHYKDSEDSEAYIIAWALDKILPELYTLRKEKNNGK